MTILFSSLLLLVTSDAAPAILETESLLEMVKWKRE